MATALLLVDVQNDFFPGGALGAPEGDAIIAPVNRLIAHARATGWPVFATRDWHPEDHGSFEAQGGPWPVHCVRETHGAAFHAAIELPRQAPVVSKATEQDRDAYSGFEGTDLADRLRDADIERVIVGGLATEYCVRSTVLDARDAGFAVTVVPEAVRGVEAEAGATSAALEEMRRQGAAITPLEAVLADEENGR